MIPVLPIISVDKNINYYQALRYRFVHLMKRVINVRTGEDLSSSNYYIVLSYGYESQTILTISREALQLADNPILIVTNLLQRYENLRRPKESYELHNKRIIK